MNLRAPCFAALLAAVVGFAHAQPQSQAVRIVVPTTAGGPIDIVARALASALARGMNDTVIVENKPGAGAMIGSDYVAKAPPDGRTLLLASGYVVTNAVLMKNAPDPLRDFRPVIELSRAGQVLVTRKGLPVQGPGDLPRLASQQPGGLNCAAPPGDAWLACEQFRQLLGGAAVTVPYPGVAPAMNALASGQVDMAVVPFDAAVAMIGRIVPLAATGPGPLNPPLDKLPLLKDSFAGFVVPGFLGVLAPAGTPDDVIRTLHRDMNNALRDPQLRDLMLSRGSHMELDAPPERLGQLLAERLAYYRKLAEAGGIRPQ